MRPIATVGGTYGPDAGPSFYMAYGENKPTGTTTAAALTADQQGGGNAPIQVVQLGPWANHPVFGKPLAWFLGLVGVLALYSYLEQKHLPTEKLGIVKIGLGNLFRVGLLAVVFLVLAKMIFAKYQIPGFSDIFLAA
jgi:hypothetical protein